MIMTIYNWIAIFAAFRRHTFLLRQGAYFFERPLFRVQYANRYIGYQVSAMTCGFVVVLGVMCLLAIPVTLLVLSALGILDRSLFLAALDALYALPSTLVLVVPVVFQLFMDRAFFFRSGWLLRRSLYAVCAYCPRPRTSAA